jgi:hypothetical protein
MRHDMKTWVSGQNHQAIPVLIFRGFVRSKLMPGNTWPDLSKREDPGSLKDVRNIASRSGQLRHD